MSCYNHCIKRTPNSPYTDGICSIQINCNTFDKILSAIMFHNLPNWSNLLTVTQEVTDSTPIIVFEIKIKPKSLLYIAHSYTAFFGVDCKNLNVSTLIPPVKRSRIQQTWMTTFLPPRSKVPFYTRRKMTEQSLHER
jgi:hypothetical protein